MRFFKVGIDHGGLESVVLKAETWAAARAIARRMWPGDDRERLWTQMLLLDGPPEVDGFPLVMEQDKETKEIVFAEGYDYDKFLPRKRNFKKASPKASGKPKKKAATKRKKAVR